MKTTNSKISRRIRICVISVPLLNIVGADMFLKGFVRILEPFSEELYLIVDGFPRVPNKKVHILGKSRCWGTTKCIPSRIRRYISAQSRASLNLVRIIRDCDLIILYSGAQLYLIPVFIAKLFQKKVLLIHQGSLSKSFKFTYGKKWFGLGIVFCWFIWLLEETILSLSDRVIIESGEVIRFLGLGRYKRKIRLGDYRYIDVEHFKITKELNKRRKLIGYVGQFTEAKGGMAFAKAVPLLITPCKDVEFLMMGRIDSSNSVERELERTNSRDKVTITERVHPDRIPGFLNDLMLLVLPSVSEGLPSIVREAMACGTPVLATPVGGVPDVIKDGETGFIMEDNSPECIARNIMRALSHPHLEEIASNAHNLVEKEYTFEKAVERYGKILDSLR